MLAKASLSITDQRRFARHRIDFKMLGEHRTRGDVSLHVANISAEGLLVSEVRDFARGDRVMIRLPVVGYLEAFCIWLVNGRAGFQFERPIRAHEFARMVGALQDKSATK